MVNQWNLPLVVTDSLNLERSDPSSNKTLLCNSRTIQRHAPGKGTMSTLRRFSKHTRSFSDYPKNQTGDTNTLWYVLQLGHHAG